MGYRKKISVHTLKFENPEYEGLVVRMKALSFGKVRKLIKATEAAEDDNFDDLFSLVDHGLASWNLEDENGDPVPATSEALNDQDFSFVLDIVHSWLDAMTGVEEELGKGSSNGQRFPGQPVTMEAL